MRSHIYKQDHRRTTLWTRNDACNKMWRKQTCTYKSLQYFSYACCFHVNNLLLFLLLLLSFKPYSLNSTQASDLLRFKLKVIKFRCHSSRAPHHTTTQHTATHCHTLPHIYTQTHILTYVFAVLCWFRFIF